MAETINITDDDVKQAAALESSLGGGGQLEAAAVDICATWRQVEPYWPWIITAVRRVPRIGGAIAIALELVGKYLAAHCKSA